jgi:hypothetical protein
MIVRNHIKGLISANNPGIDTTLLSTIRKIAVQAEGSILLEMIQYLIERMSNENIDVRADACVQVTE